MTDKKESDELAVCKLLAEYFKDEPYMIGLWILTPNPLFGGISAAQLFVMGRGHKVRQYVEAAIEESKMEGEQ